MAEGNHRGKEVCERERTLLLDEAPGEEHDEREYKTAVEHEPALVDADYVLRARRELGRPVLDDVRGPRTDYAGNHHRENAVREVLPTRKPLDERPAEKKADGHAGTVGAKVQKADVDQVREH